MPHQMISCLVQTRQNCLDLLSFHHNVFFVFVSPNDRNSAILITSADPIQCSSVSYLFMKQSWLFALLNPPGFHCSWEAHCHHRNRQRETAKQNKKRIILTEGGGQEKSGWKKRKEEGERNNCEKSPKVKALVREKNNNNKKKVKERKESVGVEHVTHWRSGLCLLKWMGLAGSLYLTLDYNLERKRSDRTCRTYARTDRLVEERRRSGLKVTIHPNKL